MEGIGLPWTDPVERSHRVDSRRPYAGVDIQDRVGTRDTEGNLPCAEAFRTDLPRTHGVVEDIPVAECFPPEEIPRGNRGVVEVGSRTEAEVRPACKGGRRVHPGDLRLWVVVVVAAAADCVVDGVADAVPPPEDEHSPDRFLP